MAGWNKSSQFVSFRNGFTLVEILIVVVILGILAAIVVPQFTSSVSDTREAVSKVQSRDLSVILMRYAMDHGGKYPGVYMIHNQLTQWTDIDGNVSGNATSTHTIKPYIKTMPSPGTGPNATLNTVSPASAPYKSGWIYDETTGVITVNLTP